MVVTGLLFIMALILLWQTFPLRYGLIGVLFREFKWTFLIILLHIGTFNIIVSINSGRKRSKTRKCGF